MPNYNCGDVHQVYVNETKRPIEVTVNVNNRCGQETTVTVRDQNGDYVHDALISAPGGTVTVSVDPTNRLHVQCFGNAHSTDGCQVELEFI